MHTFDGATKVYGLYIDLDIDNYGWSLNLYALLLVYDCKVTNESNAPMPLYKIWQSSPFILPFKDVMAALTYE